MTASALQRSDAGTGAIESRSPTRRVEKGPMMPVVLVCVWLALELARPPQPLKIPLLCSIGLTGFWLSAPRKRWHPSLTAMMALLGACVLGIPFSANQYAAFWTTYAIAVIMVSVCIPAANLLRTMRHVKMYVGTLLAFTTYVGAFAITHAGYGPAGSWGGQDENYVAAMMCVGLPFTYFGLAARSSLLTRLLLLGMGLVYIAATIIGFSRGGFLGMAAVLAFCFWYSPRKLVALVSAAIAAVAIVAIAPATYWKEMETIGDTDTGTADHRFELWSIATREYLDNPVLGVGPGNFKWRIADYQTEEQQQKFGRSLAASAVVHSTYFEVLSELGTVGIVSFAAMLFYVVRDLRRVEAACTATLARARGKRLDAVEQDLEWARAFALSLQGSLFGYMVCSAFLSTTYFSTIWLITALTVALHHAAGDLLSRTPTSGTSRGTQPPRSQGRPDWAHSSGSTEEAGTRPPRLSDMLGSHLHRA